MPLKYVLINAALRLLFSTSHAHTASLTFKTGYGVKTYNWSGTRDTAVAASQERRRGKGRRGQATANSTLEASRGAPRTRESVDAGGLAGPGVRVDGPAGPA